MALVGNDVKFEMFLDRETLQAICTGRVPWYDPEDVHGYRCDGLDPEIFPGKEVPMKFWSPDHRIALEWYARAKRAGTTSLKPGSLHLKAGFLQLKPGFLYLKPGPLQNDVIFT